MTLKPIPAFADNYIWMVHDGRDALVVDPGAASPVIDELDREQLQLHTILVTHHHADHVGGIDGLRERLRGRVYGPASERVPEPYEPLTEGCEVQALGLRLRAIEVPGHTAGHLAFYGQDLGGAPVLFCGDTLFSAGCGRLFEGTAAQMHRSLLRLSALPGATRVCCAHEYTLSNLRFAQAVDPSNAALKAYARWCVEQRTKDQPTLPSTIETELAVNPFLRCGHAEVQAAALRQGCASGEPVAIFAALREWKNRFQ
jgi:hydroxyacylglutathione hydrolase